MQWKCSIGERGTYGWWELNYYNPTIYSLKLKWLFIQAYFKAILKWDFDSSSLFGALGQILVANELNIKIDFAWIVHPSIHDRMKRK